MQCVAQDTAGRCRAKKSPKKEGFYEVERLVFTHDFTRSSHVHPSTVPCWKNSSAPLQVRKLPSGGTSEERQTREAAWKLWRKTHRLRYKKKKRLFCCKTNVADFKNPRQLLSNIKELMEQVGSGQVPVSLRLRINKRGLKCWNMLKVER